ncbi:hypothetical protein [Demequina capsici]|uniref:Uncharacterized protein n=1 Tax=Demequina capsici TaxID=3075620 RepID=A0AA96F4D4_9MICO|nr:hypothetical protein [Demequina sp. OYTSA14]WNM23826.1 hypothetical protein RN606_10710 [Demequina sp. OYTSA14]
MATERRAAPTSRGEARRHGGATARAAVLLLAVCATLAACKPVGIGDPEAVGTVAAVSVSGDVTSLSFVPDAGYEYFSGTIFHVPADVDVWDRGWNGMAASDIPAGARIEVWTDQCAESFPVQCGVTGVRVTG